jgi:hypothetical protein
VVGDACVLRFDNETGKGDHKHVGAERLAYVFATLTQRWPISGKQWKIGGPHEDRDDRHLAD